MNEVLKEIQTLKKLTIVAAKNVLTLEEAALITGLQKSYLYRLTSKHEIPFYKPNCKMLYFDRKELEDWMKRNRVQTKAEAEQQAVNYVVTGR